MHTFEIVLQPKNKDGYPLSAYWRGDKALPVEVRGQFDAEVVRKLATLLYAGREYGETLGKAIFQDRIEALFQSGLTLANAAGMPLHVSLKVEASDLRSLHWEQLCASAEGNWDYVGLNQKTPFSIHVASSVQRELPSIRGDDLRALILVAGPEDMADPSDLAGFDVAATVDSLRQAMGTIPCDVLANHVPGAVAAPTLDALCRQLTLRRYTLLHIVCHGGYDPSRDETALFMPQDEHGQHVTATELVRRLRRGDGPRLIFLSTCESADTRAETGLGSLGRRLVQDVGIPAVLAMSERISIATAQALSTAFYARLREHGQPDLALVETSAGLQGRYDIRVPVLLSRLEGRSIFDPARAGGTAPGSSEPYSWVAGISQLPNDYANRIQNFLNAYLGTPQQPEPFGGRASALQQLDEWLAGTTPGMLLAAPAGRGKSALLVRWLEGLKNRADLALAFVPVSVRFGTSLAGPFFAALAARLAYLHGESVPNRGETSSDAWRGLVAQYLNRPLADGRTLVVVLDGLDEASDWKAGPDLIPAHPVQGVRVVVAARFLAGENGCQPWLRRLGWEGPGQARTLELDPLTQVGVADVLKQTGFGEGASGQHLDLIAQIYRLSQGDPLLVHLYIEDLRAKGGTLENLQATPSGLTGYFERWWDDQQELWGDQAPLLKPGVQTAFNLLAAAQAPLLKEELAALAPDDLNTYVIDEALKALRRFIMGDGRKQGYVFSHPRLGQYFWDNLLPNERKQWTARFLNWGARTLEELLAGQITADEVPDYLLHYYGAHLENSRAPLEQSLKLVDLRWAQTWFAREGTYGGYLQDVKRAWKACEAADHQEVERSAKAPRLKEEIRCALVEASLHSLAGNLNPNLLVQLVSEGVWTARQALVHVRQIAEAGWQKTMLEALIPALPDADLNEALDVLHGMDEARRARGLSLLAGRLPPEQRAPVWLEALNAARQTYEAADVLIALSEQPQGEGWEALLRAVQEIEKEAERARVLKVWAGQAPGEAVGEILRMGREIGEEETRIEVLVACIPSPFGRGQGEGLGLFFSDYPKSGGREEPSPYPLPKGEGISPEPLLREALTICLSIADEKRRGKALGLLRGKLPQELWGEALDAVRKMGDGQARASGLQALAGGQAPTQRAELLREALQEVHSIENERERADGLRELAGDLPESLLNEALGLALKIELEKLRASVLNGLAAYLLPGQLAQALIAARKIRSRRARAELLGALAGRLPEGEQKQVLDEAVSAVQEIEDALSRAQALGSIAERLPSELQNGLLRMALEEVRAIPKPQNRIRILTLLAGQLPPEQFGEALEMMRGITSEKEQSWILRRLTGRLPAESLELALDAARGLGDAWLRARVLSELVGRLPKAERCGVLDETLRAAQDIGDEGYRVYLWCALAEHSAPDRQDELWREALGLAGQIDDDNDRVTVLNELVDRLPEDWLGTALDLARGLESENGQVNVLNRLAGRLPADQLPKMLSAVRAIRDETQWIRPLSLLAEQMPPERMDEILKVAGEIKDKGGFADVVARLVERLQENRLGKMLILVGQLENNPAYADLLLAIAIRSQPELQETLLQKVLHLMDQVIDSQTRLQWLFSLAGQLPETWLGRILGLVRTVEDDEQRARLLAILARRLPEGLLGDVLEMARALDDPAERAHILGNLIGRLAETQQEIVLGETLSAIRLMSNEEKQADELTQLAARLPERRLNEIADVAQKISKAGCQIQLSNLLARHLAQDRLGEILQDAGQIEDETARVDLLGTIAERLPAARLGEVLNALRQIQNGRARVSGLIALAGQLSDAQRAAIWNEALGVARGIAEPEKRAKALSALAGQPLPRAQREAILGEAWNAACLVSSEMERGHLLKELSGALALLPPRQRYSLWSQTLPALARGSRGGLFYSLAAMLPLVVAIGGDGMVEEVRGAVKEVCGWWG